MYCMICVLYDIYAHVHKYTHIHTHTPQTHKCTPQYAEDEFMMSILAFQLLSCLRYRLAVSPMLITPGKLYRELQEKSPVSVHFFSWRDTRITDTMHAVVLEFIP